MFTIKENPRWGFLYAVTDSRMTHDERDGIVLDALTMFLDGEKKRNVTREDCYEGVIYDRGICQSIGCFAGRRFDAELETNHGKARLGFLIYEKADPLLN